MSILKKYKISWYDIDNIYQQLNTVENIFYVTPSTSIPDNKFKTINTNHIEDLKNSIEALRINKYIGDKAITNLSIPNKKTKIKTIEFDFLSNKLDEIRQICPEDNNDYNNHNPNSNDYGHAINSNDYSHNPNDNDYSREDDNNNDYGHKTNSNDYSHNPNNNDYSHNPNSNDYGHATNSNDYSYHCDHCPEDACQPDYTSDKSNNYHYGSDCGLDCPRVIENDNDYGHIPNNYNYGSDCGIDCPGIVEG